MSDYFHISDKVKQLLEDIVARNGMSSSSHVEYCPGADVGEGYNSRTVTVDVKDDRKELHLFLKMKSDLDWHENFEQMFANETHFYNTIYPAYREFLSERNVEDGFRNAPDSYGATSEIIALDNLKLKGFAVFDNKGLMNDEHILLTMKTLAKFHAISFAFKDQKKEEYLNLTRPIHTYLADIFRKAGFDKMTSAYIKHLLKNLDSVRDKVLIDASINLEQILIDALFNIDKEINEYSIITQGDCWNNNVLFSYKEGNLEHPTDVMLVDWQVVRCGSPATDLGYFFYPIATETTIEQFDYYMKIYHEELSRRIKQLGSDPEILYPFEVFKKEWKQFTKYGFAMSFIVIQGLLMEKDEIPDFQQDPDAYSKTENPIPYMKNQSWLDARMKMILEHFVKHNFI